MDELMISVRQNKSANPNVYVFFHYMIYGRMLRILMQDVGLYSAAVVITVASQQEGFDS